jgi:putative transcription factor
MPICEMCGTDSPKAKRIFLEGSLLMVCPKCARFGQAREEEEKTEEKRREPPKKRPAPYTGKGRQGRTGGPGFDTEEMVLAEDYHKKISKARNKLGLTQEELGRKINERKSVIAKLESKQLRPNDRLRKKLERVLNIVLTEKLRAAGVNLREQARGMTIGDMIRKQKK